MMSTLLIIMLAFLVVVVPMGMHQKNKMHTRIAKQKDIVNKYLLNLPQFTVFKKYIQFDVCSGIAIDENKQKICLITNKNGASL
jgi:hypothetical protein